MIQIYEVFVFLFEKMLILEILTVEASHHSGALDVETLFGAKIELDNVSCKWCDFDALLEFTSLQFYIEIAVLKMTFSKILNL